MTDANSQAQSGDVSSLPPEVIALAGRMYDAARTGDIAIVGVSPARTEVLWLSQFI